MAAIEIIDLFSGIFTSALGSSLIAASFVSIIFFLVLQLVRMNSAWAALFAFTPITIAGIMNELAIEWLLAPYIFIAALIITFGLKNIFSR